jgi:hypothetical protein
MSGGRGQTLGEWFLVVAAKTAEAPAGGLRFLLFPRHSIKEE